ncbi:MAG: M14 family zinc carboxypeptidase [Kiritimatiellia bacterium]|jgi:predicted deacylase|nr:M14 family zinc carboxypeptidase [Kiritimatiellia bacterium]MDD4442819.1 M14 family zinc carboxypeptidase [Kiritimatiellia bacterium]MDX9792898.1 M14 family zinc carboxypeptidase [Kiritimatiellia bacterium]NLC80076.1 twin-arginine translocation signal domain-containing protein [Lentisphaerota bacterium]
MSINRRQFLAASACTGALSACTSVKPPKVKSTRFKPMSISGLEERPDFWRVRPEEIIEGCESVKKGRADVIAHTPLGYPVYAVFYGDFSEPPPQSNWSAGSASTSWKSYYGEQEHKQTILFIAGVHGAEPESGAGALNLIRMLETGQDYRGKADPELVELIAQYRLIIVPCVNMDGRALSPDHLRNVDHHTFRIASQGAWLDGSEVGWRGSKAWFPLPLDRVSYPGGYPNSEGYNIMHDCAPGDIRSAEARALLKLAARWRVDAVLNGHSYEYAPSVINPTCIDTPANIARTCALAKRANAALCAAGLREMPGGEPQARNSINLNTLFALASGAAAITLECSVSYDRPKDPRRTYTFDELMEPVFVTLKTMMKDGLETPLADRLKF